MVLGLFPLSVVMLPHGVLPLHIFEDRYKTLVADSLRRSAPFGINFVNGGSFSPVGCCVMVKKVVNTYEDGSMDILVEGVSRYRVERLLNQAVPYLQAEVVEFDDDPAEIPDTILLDECILLFEEILRAAYDASSKDMGLDASFVGKMSYAIAQKAGISLLQKQEMLELTSENDRLRSLRDFMIQVIPELRSKKSIENIRNNDGFIPPSALFS